MDFCWSSTDPIIALVVPDMGGGNQPARVSMYFFFHVGLLKFYFTWLL